MSDSCVTPQTVALGSSAHAISQGRILEWIAIFFARGSSRPRVQTPISCTGRQILYHWATREAQEWLLHINNSLPPKWNWLKNVNRFTRVGGILAPFWNWNLGKQSSTVSKHPSGPRRQYQLGCTTGMWQEGKAMVFLFVLWKVSEDDGHFIKTDSIESSRKYLEILISK